MTILPPSSPATDLNQEGADRQPARQVAALVWRPALEVPDVLLVTSRATRRWVVPKGWPIDGLSPAAAAAQEAFEEAGAVVGQGHEQLGSYEYGKVLKDGSLLACVVDVFALPALRLLDECRRRRSGRDAGTAPKPLPPV